MCDSVNEIESGPRPLINHGSVKVYDDKNRLLYIYGGIRWPDDENIKSPLRLPTADFYCYSSCSSSKPWTDFTKSMRHDKSFISPFHDRLSRPENSDLTLARIACLPALKNPIGTIMHDDTATKTSYMLILGDPTGEEYEGCNNPILICINLRINTWRRIKLKRSSKVPGGRAYASMIVSGQLRLPGCDVFLCVFGGVKEEVDEGLNTITSFSTFSVANLSKGVWTIPNAKLPNVIGRLGMHPGLAKYHDEKTGRDLILILRGVVEREDNNTENSAEATFSGTFLFDPRSAVNQFAEVRVHPPSHFPSPSRTFFLQASRSRTSSRNEFLLVTCGGQRELNEVPPIPGERNYHRRVREMYKTPEVAVWIMDLHELGNESETRAGHELRPPEVKELQIIEQIDESSTEDDDSSDSNDSDSEAEQNRERSKHSDILAQRAKRSEGQIVKRSAVTLIWSNVTSGRVKQSLELLSPAFRLEAAFLYGDIPSRSSQPEYELTHPLSPKLIFLGCDHEYIGEILGDAYNAFASISLHSLVEVDESDNVSSALLDDGEVSIGAETEISTLNDDEMSVVEDEPRFPHLNGIHSPALSIQDERSQSVRTTPAMELSDVEALSVAGNELEGEFDAEEFDGVDTNLDPTLFHHPQGLDAALLMSSSELAPMAAADIELETIVQNVLSTEREDEWDADSEDMDIYPSI